MSAEQGPTTKTSFGFADHCKGAEFAARVAPIASKLTMEPYEDPDGRALTMVSLTHDTADAGMVVQAHREVTDPRPFVDPTKELYVDW